MPWKAAVRWAAAALLCVGFSARPSAQPATGLNFLDEGQYRSIPLASTPLLGNIPDEVDLSSKFPTPGDQGRQSSCVGWAVAHLKAYQEFVERGWNKSAIEHQFSPAYIYNQIKMSPNSCDAGSNFVDALNILRKEGVSVLRDFPYDENSCSSMPSASIRQKSRDFAVADWRRVNVQDETEIKTQLASGFPVLIGMLVDDDFGRLGNEQVYSRSGGISRGGHAMVVVGYSAKRAAFKVINSWGTRWGSGGFGWIGFGAFKQAVREAYVVQDIVISRPDVVQPPDVEPPVVQPPVVQPPAPSVVSVNLGVPGLVHNQIVPSPTGQAPGMQIVIPGTVSSGAGRILQLLVKFNYLNGPPLRANPSETMFRDTAGLVTTGTPAIPIGGDQVTLDQIRVNIPYYALNFQPTGGIMNMNLSFTVIVLIDNIQKAQSVPIPFQFRW